ncbi:PREDICTED: uncharacterized protein C11orf98 homolog [Priapulus caudatus]|uniref:Uncharacterized protein C11orf98 homolog n=1 Tax=Priapulus caudatus TaxID=37621 RepID=A0ABM1EZG0_PRICU|nr:PREDICTED: uncharacterized protein C11orf98 homolog [Priapulus caudatus]
MGLHSKCCNRPKTLLQKNPNKLHRLKKAERIRQQGGQKQAGILDIGLVTPGIFKKRRTNPRANITLSGKKKRKVLKQLKRMAKEKEEMEVVVDTSAAKQNHLPTVKDIEMPDTSAASSQEVLKDVEMSTPRKSRSRSKKRATANEAGGMSKMDSMES